MTTQPRTGCRKHRIGGPSGAWAKEGYELTDPRCESPGQGLRGELVEHCLVVMGKLAHVLKAPSRSNILDT